MGTVSRHLVALVGAVAFLGVATPAFALHETDGPDPHVVSLHAGNIVGGFTSPQGACSDHGFDWGISTGGSVSGTYSASLGGTTYTVKVVFNADRTVDYESNVPVGGVAIKGGNEYTLYRYVTPQLDDDGLITRQGQSHAVFCFDLRLKIDKDVKVTYDRDVDWSITKTVSLAKWDLFVGDSGTSNYTVSVKKTVTISNVKLTGKITVTNPLPDEAPVDADITAVTDTVTIAGSDYPATVGPCTPTIPLNLDEGKSVVCDYTVSLPDTTPLDAVGTNTARVAADDGPLALGGSSVTVDVTMADAIVTKTGEPEAITVTDTFGATTTSLGEFSNDGELTYARTFSCDRDEKGVVTGAGTFGNTATITETKEPAQAFVEVSCWQLGVSKTANTEFTRTWTWAVEKWATLLGGSATPADACVSAGDKTGPLDVGKVPAGSSSATIVYCIDYSATSADSAHKVSGKIVISNPAPVAASLTAVADALSPGGEKADVTCPATTVPTGGSLECTYRVSVAGPNATTNTATATLQNYDYDAKGVATEAGTTDFSGSIDVTWSKDPATKVDDCVTPTDSLKDLSTIGKSPLCVGDLKAGPEFVYTTTVAPAKDAVCGKYGVENTADAKRIPDGAVLDSDTFTVNYEVPCAGGCTLTQGYWKTHSDRGPAPYDDTWALLGPLQEDTVFFHSGKTWYGLFWTPPAGGSTYIQLAHQYMAARLNVLNGASTTPPVDAALLGATTWFQTAGNTPTKTLSRTERTQLQGWASTLGRYNEGAIGPGHCSE